MACQRQIHRCVLCSAAGRADLILPYTSRVSFYGRALFRRSPGDEASVRELFSNDDEWALLEKTLDEWRHLLRSSVTRYGALVLFGAHLPLECLHRHESVRCP